MAQLSLVQDIQPLSVFRGNITGFIKQVQTTHRPLVITNHGRSAAVLLDVSKYEELLEQLELLQEIHLAEQQIAEGKGVGHEEALRQILVSVAA